MSESSLIKNIFIFIHRLFIVESQGFASGTKVVHIASVIVGRRSWNHVLTAPFLASFLSTSMKFVSRNLIYFSRWHLILNSYNFSESSSDLVEGAYGNTNSRLIYGVFSTPNNAIAGSAICAFSLQVCFTTSHQDLLYASLRPFDGFETLWNEANVNHFGSDEDDEEKIDSLISYPFSIINSFCLFFPQQHCLPFLTLLCRHKFLVE